MKYLPPRCERVWWSPPSASCPCGSGSCSWWTGTWAAPSLSDSQPESTTRKLISQSGRGEGIRTDQSGRDTVGWANHRTRGEWLGSAKEVKKSASHPGRWQPMRLQKKTSRCSRKPLTIKKLVSRDSFFLWPIKLNRYCLVRLVLFRTFLKSFF